MKVNVYFQSKEEVSEMSITVEIENDKIRITPNGNGSSTTKVIVTHPKLLKWNKSRKLLEEYFMALTKLNVDGEPYMTRQEVLILLKNTFDIYSDPSTNQKFTPKVKYKLTISYFVYQFYNKFGYDKTTKNTFGYFLKNSFTQFEADNIESIVSNMYKRPAKEEHIIPIPANKS